MVRIELLIATSTFFCGGFCSRQGHNIQLQYQACVEIRSVLAEASQFVPARRRMSETLDVTFPATSSRCCLKFSIRSKRMQRYFGDC